MRETPEPADDVGVVLGVFEVLAVAGFPEQRNAALLIGWMLTLPSGAAGRFVQILSSGL